MKQLGFYFDQTRCTGCEACVVACKDWNDVPAGPASWRRVLTVEKGRYPDPFVAFLSHACYHCVEPGCVSVCPTSAISKREEDGIVVLNSEKCVGREECGLCERSCPYGAPQFGAGGNPKMQKCDFCLKRWAEDKKPICVEACPLWALDAGPLDEIESRYGSVREAMGFEYSTEMRPCAIFKPRLSEGESKR